MRGLSSVALPASLLSPASEAMLDGQRGFRFNLQVHRREYKGHWVWCLSVDVALVIEAMGADLKYSRQIPEQKNSGSWERARLLWGLLSSLQSSIWGFAMSKGINCPQRGA